MPKSFVDPQWAEFEQLNSKTIVSPRTDFTVDFGSDQFAAIGAKLNIDFVSGISYRVGDVVFNASDSLFYRCIETTDSAAPDYSNSTSNLYWTWIAGSISGFVSGRGWWTKYADGKLEQKGTKEVTEYPQVVDFPIDFYDTTYVVIPSWCKAATAGRTCNENPALHSISQFSAWSYNAVTGNTETTGNLSWIAIGRWKS